MSADPLYSVYEGTNAGAVAGLIRVLYPDARTCLDMTYGNGSFWERDSTKQLRVTGLDIDPARGIHLVGDFTRLPFADNSFDLAIFDPPYQADMGRAKPSIMGARFATFQTMTQLEVAVRAGCQEASRVSRIGAIIKVQDYIHASRAVWMSDWVKEAMDAEPFDSMIFKKRTPKVIDPKWAEQLSIWRVHSTFWAFRHDGPIHKRRRSNGHSGAQELLPGVR